MQRRRSLLAAVLVLAAVTSERGPVGGPEAPPAGVIRSPAEPADWLELLPLDNTHDEKEVDQRPTAFRSMAPWRQAGEAECRGPMLTLSSPAKR